MLIVACFFNRVMWSHGGYADIWLCHVVIDDTLFFVVILMLLTYKSFVTDLILVFYICYLPYISFLYTT